MLPYFTSVALDHVPIVVNKLADASGDVSSIFTVLKSVVKFRYIETGRHSFRFVLITVLKSVVKFRYIETGRHSFRSPSRRAQTGRRDRMIIHNNH